MPSKSKTTNKTKLKKLTEEEFLSLRDSILNECFDKNSGYFDNMVYIISFKKNGKSKIIHKHHIIPRSYFQKKGLVVVDNNNLAELTPFEHALVHYYAWKCAKPIIKKSMSMAWHYMSLSALKAMDMDFSIIALGYHNSWINEFISIKEINKKIKKEKLNISALKYKDGFLEFKCKKCGHIIPISFTNINELKLNEIKCKKCISNSEKESIYINKKLFYILELNYINTKDNIELVFNTDFSYLKSKYTIKEVVLK